MKVPPPPPGAPFLLEAAVHFGNLPLKRAQKSLATALKGLRISALRSLLLNRWPPEGGISLCFSSFGSHQEPKKRGKTTKIRGSLADTWTKLPKSPYLGQRRWPHGKPQCILRCSPGAQERKPRLQSVSLHTPPPESQGQR